jgi:ribosomal-protein-alanine N-acetyltransferase
MNFPHKRFAAQPPSTDPRQLPQAVRTALATKQKPMTLRPATLDDVPALMALKDNGGHADNWRRDLNSAFYALVATVDGAVVGMVVLTPLAVPGHANRIAELTNLYVAEDHRQRGVGTGLVNAAIAFARAQQINGIILRIDECDEVAARLYTRAGFVSWGEITLALPGLQSKR